MDPIATLFTLRHDATGQPIRVRLCLRDERWVPQFVLDPPNPIWLVSNRDQAALALHPQPDTGQFSLMRPVWGDGYAVQPEEFSVVTIAEVSIPAAAQQFSNPEPPPPVLDPVQARELVQCLHDVANALDDYLSRVRLSWTDQFRHLRHLVEAENLWHAHHRTTRPLGIGTAPVQAIVAGLSHATTSLRQVSRDAPEPAGWRGRMESLLNRAETLCQRCQRSGGQRD